MITMICYVVTMMFTIVGIAGLICLVWSQVRPPNYSPDQLPETSFTCEDKVKLVVI